MKKGLRHRVNLFLDDEHHRLLKIHCAELVLTLEQGATKLVVDGLFKVGQRVATPPWAREPIAPLHTQEELQAQIPGTPYRVTRAEAAANLHEMPMPEPLREWQKRCPECSTAMEKKFTSCPECQFVFEEPPLFRTIESNLDPETQAAHVAVAESYTITSEAPAIDENKVEAEAPSFDPQAHYDEVVRKLSPRSALEDTRRAIEYYFLDDKFPNWNPGDAPVTNGHAASPAGGPITAKEFEVPGTWVDNAGHTRAQNLSRFGEDEAIEYWPPT